MIAPRVKYPTARVALVGCGAKKAQHRCAASDIAWLKKHARRSAA